MALPHRLELEVPRQLSRELQISLSLLAEMRAVLLAALPFSEREEWSKQTMDNLATLPILLRYQMGRRGDA